uniref:Uncharacterized protein n=1 Tax=Clytia hemisphaerica TaxID=252671 RepID=A0A7M5XNU5_9CNID
MKTATILAGVVVCLLVTMANTRASPRTWLYELLENGDSTMSKRQVWNCLKDCGNDVSCDIMERFCGFSIKSHHYSDARITNKKRGLYKKSSPLMNCGCEFNADDYFDCYE